MIKNNTWKDFVEQQQSQKYFIDIILKYKNRQRTNITYPNEKDVFKAFELTDFDKIKVVIIGQDPYMSICKQSNIPFANGLAFSVNSKCELPQTLKNMFNELDYDRTNGDLSDWANQGVFLLNSQLTVTKGRVNSHRYWKKFTDNVIKYISDNSTNIVFVLMGRNALYKKRYIDENKHSIIITSHPSPNSCSRKLQSYQKFCGSNIFNQINDELKRMKQKQIKW